MKIEERAIDDPQWEQFVDAHPAAMPFHLPAWAGLIADCYRFRAFALVAVDTDGELLAGLPVVAVSSPLGGRRWVSLPFTDSCPPLLREDARADAVFGALRDHVLSAEVHELEVRATLPLARQQYPVIAGYLHKVALPDDPAMVHPSKSHRNGRNQAIRAGVQVTYGDASEDMATFYRLHTLTRRRHGVPVQPRRFFELLQDRVIAPGHGFVATAMQGEDVLAVGVYLVHNGTLVAKYLASDPRFRDRKAGYLIDWESLVWACSLGYHTLDLGRSDPDADGLRLYKSSWGAVEELLLYTHISQTDPSDHVSPVASLSHQVIRHSPQAVCRGLGEALYRWVA